MLKVVSINRREGTGIIERIEGNGWDIDAEHIELNGINAQIINDPENRFITLNGPAVDDLFKSLRDLLKENGKLRMDIDDMKKENTGLRNYIDEMEKGNEPANYCINDVLATEALHLRQIVEEQDKGIKRLKNDLKGKDASIKALQFDKDHYEESCKILKRSIEEKNNHINMIDKLLGDKDAEIDELNDKLKKCNITKEIIGWLRGIIENKTDYATKIFNKESKENIFSITFCKVPVEPEGVANEQS